MVWYRTFLAKKDDKWGYLDYSNHWTIEPQFLDASVFSPDGTASVWMFGNKKAVIDKTGAQADSDLYGNGYFSQGLAEKFAQRSESTPPYYGYINGTGDWIIDPSFLPYKDTFGVTTDFYSFFSERTLMFDHNSNRYGYINLKGEVVVLPNYDDARPFSEDLAAVCVNDSWGFINDKGTMIITPNYIMAKYYQKSTGYFNFGLAPVGIIVENNVLYGYIDVTGEWVILPQFTSAHPFDENGVAPVESGAMHGYVNREGNYLILWKQ